MAGKKTKTDAERFWAKVNKTDTCWLWTGGKVGRKGSVAQYGSFCADASRAGHKGTVAHRWIWAQTYGCIPEGHEVDHKCGVHLCVRLDHLQLVTKTANRQRGRWHGFLMNTNSSGYRGVYPHSTVDKWVAQVRVDKVTTYLGYFDYPEAAAVMYNVAALKAFGPDFHNLNIVEMG